MVYQPLYISQDVTIRIETTPHSLRNLLGHDEQLKCIVSFNPLLYILCPSITQSFAFGYPSNISLASHAIEERDKETTKHGMQSCPHLFCEPFKLFIFLEIMKVNVWLALNYASLY